MLPTDRASHTRAVSCNPWRATIGSLLVVNSLDDRDGVTGLLLRGLCIWLVGGTGAGVHPRAYILLGAALLARTCTAGATSKGFTVRVPRTYFPATVGHSVRLLATLCVSHNAHSYRFAWFLLRAPAFARGGFTYQPPAYRASRFIQSR